MTSSELARIGELLPHAGDAILLTRVLEHDATQTVCSVDLGSPSLFSAADGTVEAWVGIEYMAQCIAAHAGLIARTQGKSVRPGFLIGARALDFHVARFRRGQQLRVLARHTWGAETGMVSFDCSIHDATTRAVLAEGRLNCFLPPEGEGDEAWAGAFS